MTSILAQLDLSDTGACGSFNFRRTARAVTRFYDDALQNTGIRSTQFAILVGIAKNQPASIGALSDVLVIDGTTLSRSLRLLKKDGLVAVSPRSAMRQRFLTITPKGERILARALPVWRKAHKRFVASLGSHHWLDLRSELERLAHTAMDFAASRAKIPAPARVAH
jgi:DNA-binding MarR family transcriptional regulator